ncbi:YgdB family protein [Brenneria izbisi]|uniref:YgdB family protein n=1 Tax=Brenneria izbisi TaxID=2939450 RepID=A0AA41XXH5_9GAMM|nr:YgdB family protein [Brenneria izbisi]MCV9879199.1 YgdB family protein [Brenneria izbisi]MCV9882767.1 YgdB family protein [Brenneria izbisi]
MNGREQYGGGTLVMVMLITVIGLLLMSGLQRQLDATIQMGNDERHYLRAFNQALSSLNWGIHVVWPRLQDDWSCQTLASDTLNVCLKKASDEGLGLLRGEGLLPSQRRPLFLYQRVVFSGLASEQITLKAVSRGWLDFCPDSEAERCADLE